MTAAAATHPLLPDPLPDDMHDATLAITGIEGNHLGIAFHSHDDEGWVSASVTIRAGHFAGGYHASLLRDEIELLRQGLERLAGDFSEGFTFASSESWLRLEVSGDRHGHLLAHCRARDPQGAEIAFDLRFDQSYLPDLGLQLAYILKSFPGPA